MFTPILLVLVKVASTLLRVNPFDRYFLSDIFGTGGSADVIPAPLRHPADGPAAEMS